MEQHNINSVYKLIISYFKSEEKFKAYSFIITLILLTLFIVSLNVAITYWYKYFWDALQAYNKELVFEMILIFLGLASVFIIASVYQYYIQAIFDLRWRKWLTHAFMTNWMFNKKYYHLEAFDETTDNPDQRIQEDIDLFVSLSTNLFLGVINAITTIFSFVILLWTLSEKISIPLGPLGTWHIDGYLVWVALFYSIGGTYLIHKVGKPLIKLNFNKQRREADFRYKAVQIRNNAEHIALYHSENNEKGTVLDSFRKVIEVTLSLIKRQKLLLYFTSGFNQISILIPLFASLPLYFAKKINIGGIMQIASAFGQVQGSLSFIVNSYTTIAQWKAVVDRLLGFSNRLDNISVLTEQNNELSFCLHDKNSLTAENMQVYTKNGEHIFANITIHFEKGKSHLIKGPSGIGKTTLIKVIAGIWPFAKGIIKMPNGQKFMYIPQKAYLPIGTLRDVIIYPSQSNISDDKIYEFLDALGLSKFKDKLHETKKWSEVLSLGEQQRLNFIRVIINKPDWVFLDESTSAMDLASEAKAYNLLKQKLEDCTIVSVAHRESLQQYHNREIMLDKL